MENLCQTLHLLHLNKPNREPTEFFRSRWTHAGPDVGQFFQQFVPNQYAVGFCWRCQVIGGGEESRTTPFENQSRPVQEIIAKNAEVLLELFEETVPLELDLMRASGKIILQSDIKSIDLEARVEGDLPALRESMGRRHHAKWLEQFQADLATGKRSDPDHRGAKPYEDLPEIELLVMKVQVLANRRVLGSLAKADYKIVRSSAEKRSS